MFSSLLGLLASIHAVVFDGLQTPLGELADKPVIATDESTVHLSARFNILQRRLFNIRQHVAPRPRVPAAR